jgi:Tol biopolymer transport system component
MDGGSPQTIVENGAYWPHWSPDGNLLVFTNSGNIQLFDLRTGKGSLVPASKGMQNPQWVGEDQLFAATQDHGKLMVFNLRTQQWSDLVSFTPPGYVVGWAHSPDTSTFTTPRVARTQALFAFGWRITRERQSPA